MKGNELDGHEIHERLTYDYRFAGEVAMLPDQYPEWAVSLARRALNRFDSYVWQVKPLPAAVGVVNPVNVEHYVYSDSAKCYNMTRQYFDLIVDPDAEIVCPADVWTYTDDDGDQVYSQPREIPELEWTLGLEAARLELIEAIKEMREGQSSE